MKKSMFLENIYMTLAQEIASKSLRDLSKQALRKYCNLVRKQWKDFDLKASTKPMMIAYLREFLQFKDGLEVFGEETPEVLALQKQLVNSSPFVLAIASLNIDNPNLLTGEGLADLLFEVSTMKLIKGWVPKKYPSLQNPLTYVGLTNMNTEQFNSYGRVISCPSEFVEQIPEHAEQGVEWYGKMGKMFGFDAMRNIAYYHCIKSNIQELQQSMNISAIEPRKDCIRGKDLQYLDFSDQLVVLEQDKVALKEQALKLGEFFLKVVKMPEIYNLSEIETDDNDKEFGKPCTYSKIEDIAQNAIYARIYAESLNWEHIGGKQYQGTYCDRLDPDKIVVRFAMAWDDAENEPTNFIEFVGEHPDSSRFPFRD